jgi:hypothetical protein
VKNPKVVNATLPAGTAAGISGNVTDSNGNAIPNVTVSAYTTDTPPQFVKSTVSTADGTYSLVGLTDGTSYEVFFDGAAMGYTRAFFTNDSNNSNAATVTAPYADINVMLAQGSSISGTVSDGINPISGVQISPSTDVSGAPSVFCSGTVTDADGNYIVNGLPIGYYYLVFDGSRLTPAYNILISADPAATGTSGTNAALTQQPQ